MVSKKESKSISVKTVFLIFILLALLLAGGTYYYLTKMNNKSEQVYFNLGENTVNVQNSENSTSHYLKYEFYIGYDKNNKKIKKQLSKEGKLPVINDTINGYIQCLDYSFLSDPKNEEKIKSQLLSEINNELSDFQLNDIRITKFLLQ